MDENKMTQQEESREREALVVLYVLGAAIVAVVLWIAHARLFLTNQQLIELPAFPLLAIAFAISVLRYYATRQLRIEEQWPRTAPAIAPSADRKHLAEAAAKDAVLVGHRTNGSPFYWANHLRSMQAICFGQTGAGKSTLLESLTQQDIARVCPIIIMDGKGEQELLQSLLPAIRAAGRMHQLRLIDPQHSEYSAFYNPLWVPDGGSPEDQVSFIFDSFQMNTNEFFDSHQRVYLENLVRILHYSGRRFNFHDILVIAYDVSKLKNQVQVAMANMARLATSPEERRALAMSVHNLAETFDDKERVPKIQGLINHLMTFMTKEMARITGAYENVVTMDEVIDKRLILYASLNTNINGTAITSLGRILLQNLQLMIGRRYSKSSYGTVHPFVSVIMDEFAPFAYQEFAQIINQARGTNVAFLFALQNQSQLLQVGESFRSDLSSSPNTTFMLRVKDDPTAKMFLDASSRVKQMRRSVQFATKGLFAPRYEEQNAGTQTEVYDSAAKDEHLKRMPTGQMEALVTDHQRGAILEHIHVRQAFRSFLIESTADAFYPSLTVCRKQSQGLHLTFSGLPSQLTDTRTKRTNRRNSSLGGLR
jgi:type IV secretory system conjugative DNA transfer VirD4/TraG family protein